MKLPKIIIFPFIFFFFFLPFKTVKAQSVTATPIPTPNCTMPNPNEYYTLFQPSIKSVLDNEWCMRRNETTQQGGTVNVANQRTNNADILLTMVNITTQIIPFEKYAMPPLADGPSQPKAKTTALEYLAGAMETIYQNPPASGIAYTKYVLANAGLLAKPAYAQGIGFAGFSPLLPLWTTMRNIAYTVIVIIMVIIGFMVIFRMKIDPKTVISVQMALPKIVVSLILITFSYAIVGFMIDLMYLIMTIAISVFLNGAGYNAKEISTSQTNLITGTIFDLAGFILKGGAQSAWDIATSTPGLVGGVVSNAVGIILAFVLHVGVLGLIAIPAIIGAIIALGLLFTFIRLILLLLNSYIQLIIAVILGPLQLLTEAIPGKSAFGEWIRNIIANLVVFPATIMVILLSIYISDITTNPSINNISDIVTRQSFWMPPLLGFSGSANYDFNFFNGLLSLTILFIAPNLVASVKKMFKPKAGLPLSTGTIIAPITGSLQTTMGAASNFYYMMNIKQMVGGLFGGKGGQHPKTP